MDVSKMIYRLKTYQNGVHGDFFLEVADLLTSLMTEKEPSAQSPAAMAGSKALVDAMSNFVSYAVTCRKSNNEDWMNGLAEAADKFCEAFEEPARWQFNGDTIVPVKEP